MDPGVPSHCPGPERDQGSLVRLSSRGVCPQTKEPGDPSHPHGSLCPHTRVPAGAACPQGAPGWVLGRGFLQCRGSTGALSVLPCSDKFTRFCQWKNVELNIHVSRGSSGDGGHGRRGTLTPPSLGSQSPVALPPVPTRTRGAASVSSPREAEAGCETPSP